MFTKQKGATHGGSYSECLVVVSSNFEVVCTASGFVFYY